MKMLTSSFAVLATFALVLPSGAEDKEEGWVSIYNGENLEGWKSNEEVAGVFTIEDGAIKVSGGRAHLFYAGPVADGNFKNFEFKAKVKTMKGSNSGIYFHTAFQESGWPEKGYECQVNNTHADPRKTASLYAIKDQMDDAPAKDDEWFDYHIKVDGKDVTISINGKAIIEYTEPDSPERPDSMKGRLINSGTFCFQGHDPKSTTFYKEIFVKVLPDGK